MCYYTTSYCTLLHNLLLYLSGCKREILHKPRTGAILWVQQKGCCESPVCCESLTGARGVALGGHEETTEGVESHHWYSLPKWSMLER